MNGKQTQKRRFMWACSVAAIVLCCSLQPCCAALCAMCMQLGAGRALLCAAVLPVCSRALVCSAVCVALLCCALCCILLCYVCCVRMNSCAVWVEVCHAFRETLLCSGLPCCAVLCPTVRWSRRVIPNREDLCGWPGARHHARCTKYSKVTQCGRHFESILRPCTDLG